MHKAYISQREAVSAQNVSGWIERANKISSQCSFYWTVTNRVGFLSVFFQRCVLLFWEIMMPLLTCVLFCRVGRKKMRLRYVKMHTIADFGHCARSCLLIWIPFPVPLLFYVSVPFSTSSLFPLPSLSLLSGCFFAQK